MTDDPILDARARAGRAIPDLAHPFVGRHATLEQIERLSDVLEGISGELWPTAIRHRGDHEGGPQSDQNEARSATGPGLDGQGGPQPDQNEARSAIGQGLDGHSGPKPDQNGTQ